MGDYRPIAELVNQNPHTDIPKDARSCQDRYYYLKKRWQTLQDMEDASGFGWDSDLCVVTADDRVWERYFVVSCGPEVIRGAPFAARILDTSGAQIHKADRYERVIPKRKLGKGVAG